MCVCDCVCVCVGGGCTGIIYSSLLICLPLVCLSAVILKWAFSYKSVPMCSLRKEIGSTTATKTTHSQLDLIISPPVHVFLFLSNMSRSSCSGIFYSVIFSTIREKELKTARIPTKRKRHCRPSNVSVQHFQCRGF